MSKVDRRSETAKINLAKAREAKLAKLAKQKELDKYIIYDDSDTDSDDWSDSDEPPMEKPKKGRGKKQLPAAPKPPRKKQLKSDKSLQKAEALKKEIEKQQQEIEALRKEFSKATKPEPKEEPTPVVPQAIPPVPKPIPQSEIIRRNTLLKFN